MSRLYNMVMIPPKDGIAGIKLITTTNTSSLIQQQHQMARPLLCMAICLASLTLTAVAYTIPKSTTSNGNNLIGHHRRTFLSNVISNTIATAAIASTTTPSRALAAADDVQEDVYFGAGCFWHVQQLSSCLSYVYNYHIHFTLFMSYSYLVINYKQ